MSHAGQASNRPLVTTVSLENVLLDVKELGRGMELIRRECSIHDNSVLRSFLSTNEGRLDKLQRDAKTAEASKGWRSGWEQPRLSTRPLEVGLPQVVRQQTSHCGE